MIKLIKRLSDYSDDFENYCARNGLDPKEYGYMYRTWAIRQHDTDLLNFIVRVGENRLVKVSGSIMLDNVSHRLKPKVLSLFSAFDKILTPDAQDYNVAMSVTGCYYVYVIHARGHNFFKVRLYDEDRKTTVGD